MEEILRLNQMEKGWTRSLPYCKKASSCLAPRNWTALPNWLLEHPAFSLLLLAMERFCSPVTDRVLTHSPLSIWPWKVWIHTFKSRPPRLSSCYQTEVPTFHLNYKVLTFRKVSRTSHWEQILQLFCSTDRPYSSIYWSSVSCSCTTYSSNTNCEKIKWQVFPLHQNMFCTPHFIVDNAQAIVSVSALESLNVVVRGPSGSAKLSGAAAQADYKTEHFAVLDAAAVVAENVEVVGAGFGSWLLVQVNLEVLSHSLTRNFSNSNRITFSSLFLLPAES